MKRFSELLAVSSFRYPNYLFRLLTSFLATNLIILYEERHSFKDILTTPYYYRALLPNMLIAYLIISFVFRTTRSLDYHLPWSRSHRRRMPWQVFWGVIIPLFPAFLLATIYFAVYEINIFDTVYFRRYLQQIIFMLFVLNGFILYYWHKKNREKKIPKAMLTNELMEIDCGQIAVIFAEDKHYFAYNFKGEKIVWAHSLGKSWDYLPAEHFVTVNRSYIINRAAILEIKIVSGKRINVVLIPPLNLDLFVSQRESVTFKKWWTANEII